MNVEQNDELEIRNSQPEIRNSETPFAVLRRFVKQRAVVERCELCSAEVHSQHEHLVDISTRQMVCACQACAILFSGKANTKYRRVPQRIISLANFQMTDSHWESLLIPISMAFFFSVLTAGLAATLPSVMYQGLVGNGLPASVAHSIANLPPIGVLFAAFLGYNPMQSLVPASVAAHLSAQTQATLFGKAFFPHLILPAVINGLHLAFYVSAGMALVAALASLLRGKRYIHGEEEAAA